MLNIIDLNLKFASFFKNLNEKMTTEVHNIIIVSYSFTSFIPAMTYACCHMLGNSSKNYKVITIIITYREIIEIVEFEKLLRHSQNKYIH